MGAFTFWRLPVSEAKLMQHQGVDVWRCETWSYFFTSPSAERKETKCLWVLSDITVSSNYSRIWRNNISKCKRSTSTRPWFSLVLWGSKKKWCHHSWFTTKPYVTPWNRDVEKVKCCVSLFESVMLCYIYEEFVSSFITWQQVYCEPSQMKGFFSCYSLFSKLNYFSNLIMLLFCNTGTQNF